MRHHAVGVDEERRWQGGHAIAAGRAAAEVQGIRITDAHLFKEANRIGAVSIQI